MKKKARTPRREREGICETTAPFGTRKARANEEGHDGQAHGLGDSILGNFGLSTRNFKTQQDATGAYSVQFVPNEK